jgi:hypothetical protein
MALSRYRRAAVAAIAVGLLALTACGNKAPQDPNAQPDGQGQIGDAPSASASASANGTPAATAATQGGGGGGGTSNPYPSNAKDYGLEILKAIANKDNVRLAALADLNTVNYAQQYQNKNGQWTHTDCADGATVTCHYYNQTGDIASVGMMKAKLGGQGAGVSVYLEQGTYPTNASSYVQSFVYNWTFTDSYAHMVSLSSPSIVSYVKTQQKLNAGGGGITTSNPHPCATNASKTCVDASAVGGTLNLPTYHFIVDPAKISAGKPNGIVGYEPAT